MAKSILIVEDNVAIAETIFDFLVMEGYGPCSIAKSYQEAITKLQDLDPDFAILDINLEGELTGIDVAKFIREGSNKPFIYHSAALEPKLFETAMATKPFAFLPKPLEFTRLCETIESALSGRSAERSSYVSGFSIVTSSVPTGLVA